MNKTITLADINKECLLTYLKSLNHSTECEIRFGEFIYTEGTLQKAEFASNVEIDFFYRLKQSLDNQKTLKKTHVYTKEIYYKNADDKKGKLRETIFTNSEFQPTGKKEYMVKNTHRQHNIFDYNCRISLASEKTLTQVDGVSLHSPLFFRFKNRLSYTFHAGVLDMTIVYQGKTQEEALSKKNIQYEVEFEINKPDYESIVNMMSFVLSVRQDNLYVMNTREKRNIINQYRSLVMPQKKGHPYFIGAQPETLQKDQLSLLFKELYSVTDKADGDRFFLFIDTNGYVTFIDNNINNILKTDLKSNSYTNCLIDGELIRVTHDYHTSKISFHAFDIAFYNGQDLRGDEEFLLKQRLELLNTVVSSIPQNSYYDVKLKRFIYRNVFMGSDIIMKNIQNNPYKNDGLIFTPMNEPYPKSKKWTKLLKWKPAELNTIDFYSVKEGNVWKLYVQEIFTGQVLSNTFVKRKPNLVLFDVNKLCNIPETTQITFETSFEESRMDPTTNEPFQTNTVIEYQWLGDKFAPLRTRWDKTANPSKHGNFSSVACSIWNNIHAPITPSQLFQMTNTTTEQVSDKNFFFERLSNFHSKINQYLTNKYVPDLNTSECDKGVVNLELNTFNLLKTNNTFTFCNSIKKTNINYKNFKLDLTSDNSCNIIKQSIKELTNDNINIKTICCLKFNPFFKSLENLNKFMEIVDYNLTNGGKLLLSFMDSEQVNKINNMYVKDNEIMYYIEQDNKSQDQIFNNYIKCFINGISNESDPIEYVVNYNYLLEFMKEKGYTCLESESYENLYKMFMNSSKDNLLNDYEQNISNLYRYCVFEKIESKITSVLSNDKIDMKIDMTPRNKHLIEHKSLDFYKLHSSYDIYNLLNCINCNVFKHMHKKSEITSFNDITSSLKQSNMSDKFVPYFKGQTSVNKPMIYFYKHYYEEEANEGEEPLIINQFYVILYNGTILQNTQQLHEINELLEQAPKQEVVKQEEIKQEPKKEVKQEPKQEVKQEVKQKEKVSHKDTIKNEMITLGKKITLVKIKEYLKQLNCKTSGNKDELLQRLNEQLI
jgi:hypothetical protein